MTGSMIDTAYGILNNRTDALPFLSLFKEVSDELGFSQSQYESNIAHFFSDLSMDNRFVSRPNNNWDLKKRHATKDTRINLDEIRLDDDESEEDEFEEEDIIEETSDDSDDEEDE